MKIKVGFIGCGGWAQETYIPYLTSNSDIELVSLSGILPASQGEIIKHKYKFKNYYQNWEDMIKDEKLDLVFISTPHYLHYNQIKKCILEGINVHVDKPPALTTKEVNQLISLAQKKKVIVNVHVQKRFSPEYIYVKDILEENKLGKIEYVSLTFAQQLFEDFEGSWRSDPKLSGGGIMMDSGYHMIDLLTYLFNLDKIKTIHMQGNKGDLKSDRFSMLNIQLENGCVISIHTVRGLPRGFSQEELKIVGKKGYLKISKEKKEGNKNFSIEHYTALGARIDVTSQKVSNEKISPLVETLKYMKEKNYKNKTLLDAYKNVEILEKGYKSMTVNKVI